MMKSVLNNKRLKARAVIAGPVQLVRLILIQKKPPCLRKLLKSSRSVVKAPEVKPYKKEV
jgi:hypothetical protein